MRARDRTMKPRSAERILLIALLLTFGFDQLSKDAARILGFEMVFNTGVSLSTFQHIPSEVIVVVTLAVLCVLWYVYAQLWKEKPVLSGIFFGAGLSNIFDRVWYGAVRDWLPVPGTSITNNLADWLLFLVITAFAVNMLKEHRVR